VTTLYVALGNAVLIAQESEGRWRSEEHLSGLPASCLAADPQRPDVVYCGTFGSGLWRSGDAGANWARIAENAVRSEITALAMAPSEGQSRGHSGRLYVGTEPTEVYITDDDGNSWSRSPDLDAMPSRPTWSFPPRPYTHHARWIEPDVAAPGRVYLCVEAGGVMLSQDGGVTWRDRVSNGPMDAHTLRTHRLAPGRAYAAAGDGYRAPGEGYAESRDGGETWRRIGDGLRHHYLWSVAVDPADPETIVVSASSGPAEAHNATSANSTIYRRADGGPWREVRAGLPESQGTLVAVLATNQAEPGVFYLASNRGVFRSEDKGQAWERLAIDWPEPYLRARPAALIALP
jgi:photosystem II stability/assembly factor-like uncharacterized protein